MQNTETPTKQFHYASKDWLYFLQMIYFITPTLQNQTQESEGYFSSDAPNMYL
jgi:hypothetical protein